MDLNYYNNGIGTILTHYQPMLNDIFHNNETELNLFLSDINNFIGGTTDVFLKKSFLNQKTQFANYNPLKQFLSRNSANCQFQIADVTSPNGMINRFFYKIVNYNSQNRAIAGNVDLLIFDVISALIIENLKRLIPYSINFHNIKNINLSDHFPNYRGQYLSYYFHDATTQNQDIWNLNDLVYTNNISPHSYNSIITRNPFPYNSQCIVMIYDSIELKSLEDIFVEFAQAMGDTIKRGRVINAIYQFLQLFNVLKFLGINYGFVHNDLHAGNIIYNLDTNKLMFIDLGRVSFKKFIDHPVPLVDNFVNYHSFELGYTEIYNNAILQNYKSIYNPALFIHLLSNKTTVNNYYHGFLFDTITLTLQTHTKMLWTFGNLNPTLIGHVLPYLNSIVHFDYNNNLNNLIGNSQFSFTPAANINQLFANFYAAKTVINGLNIAHNIDAADVNITKELFNEIANGLLLTALFLHSRGIPIINIDRVNRQATPPFHFAFQIISRRVQDFYNYISNLYLNVNYKVHLDKVDYINIICSPALSGGSMKSSIKSNKSLKSYKNLKSKKNNLTNDEVFNNYLNVYKLKEELSYKPKNKVLSKNNPVFNKN